MSFAGFFRGAPHPPPVDPEGWQVGDLAECIGTGAWFDSNSQQVDGPRLGQVLKVTGVTTGRTIADAGLVLGLRFAAWPDTSWVARAFRKVRPRADEATPAEAEFVQLVRRQPAPSLPRETIEEHQ